MNVFLLEDRKLPGVERSIIVKRGADGLGPTGVFEYRAASGEFATVRDALIQMQRGPVINACRRCRKPVEIILK